MAFFGKQIHTCTLESIPDTEEFDFIVVGSGSAGAVVAARLSEDPSESVLLLEAGDEAVELEAKIPAAVGKLQRTERDWQYYTEPSESSFAQGLQNKRSFWPRGKCLGGSSILNYMAYVRGCKEDYDTWAACGAKGWSYSDVLPYFLKAENCEANESEEGPIEKLYHGSSGPLSVSIRQPVNPISIDFVNAANKLGFEIRDYNASRQNNTASLLQQTVRKGQRCGTDIAYLKPASRRPNLKICVNSHVCCVTLDGSATRATGVIVAKSKGANSRMIKARKEVVLSAGTIGSAQIMLLSGIGPKHELEKVGVECKLDLPDVGKNMEDHIACILRYNAKGQKDIGSVNAAKVESFPGNVLQLLRWMIYGSGHLASSAYDATLFCKSSVSRSESPDLQVGLYTAPASEREFYHNIQYEHSFLKDARALEPNAEGILMVPCLLHPLSRGEITLKSNDPFAHPRIEPNYLNNETDMQAVVDVIKLCNKIAQTPPLSWLIEETPLIPPEYGSINSDEVCKKYYRNFGCTLYHPTSTLKIGKVVDERLRVYGIPNLRVCDASIMPTITSGNTNAPVIMIGEKGADLIAKDNMLKQTLQTESGVSTLYSFL